MTAAGAPARGNAGGAARQAPQAAARGLALFLGGFGLANITAGLRNPGLDMNLWWIDLRPLRGWASQPLLAVAAFCLLAYGAGLRVRALRGVSLLATAGLVCAAALNARRYYLLRASGSLHSGTALPFSLLLAVACVLLLAAMARRSTPRLNRWARALLVLSFLAALVAFPVAQVYCFGTTDYRRQADAIIVFGAHATPDNRPSLALSDRVRTACALYHEGWAPRLVLSGGPTGGTGHESEAMRRLATELGVPNRAITLDRSGLSTHDTVRNTTRLFTRLHVRRVLAVSHFYHLPRIKMSYQRAGWDVFTVPAQHPRQPAGRYPFMLLRETAAMWAYYLRGS